MVFDWVVTGYVFDVNPAHDVTTMSWKRQEVRLTPELLDGIATTKKRKQDHTDL